MMFGIVDANSKYIGAKVVKGQTKLTFTWHTPNRVNIK